MRIFSSRCLLHKKREQNLIIGFTLRPMFSKAKFDLSIIELEKLTLAHKLPKSML